MKKVILIFVFAFAGCLVVHGQKIAVKNNILSDATLSPNLALEFRLASKSTLELGYSGNYWVFSGRKQLRHNLFEGEYRYWMCEAFNGTFLGAHLIGVPQYDVGAIKLPLSLFTNLETHRYYGWAYGAGVSIGHQWILGKRWNMEAGIGAGYARIFYKKYECAKCAPIIESNHHNYWGITKASISLVFLIK